MKILIAEDTGSIARNIQEYLRLKDISSDIVNDGKTALYKATIDSYDVLILDIGLPEMNGLEVCKILRERGKNIPILFLTSRSTRHDIISGLKTGGDDYMTKPFDFEELFVRIEVLTRRAMTHKSTTKISFGSYQIDIENALLFREDICIHLSALEFKLLKYLVQNAGKIISKEELYEKVWGEYDLFKMGKTVDVYIGYLRRKIGASIIETIKGKGYKIMV